MIRHRRWAVLPDQRNELAMEQTFAEGTVEIDVRLILEGDQGRPSQVVGRGLETFTLAKTNQLLEDEPLAEEPAAIEVEEPEVRGAVTIRAPQRNEKSKLYVVAVDVLPPVKRVEFEVDCTKVLARNAPPYTAELDLGDAPDGVTLRAIGYDADRRYVDADALVIGAGDALGVTITRTVAPDGISHFKLTVRNPRRMPLQSVVLYAGERKLAEWDQPPYTLAVPNASLAGAAFVRVSVIDESGFEASERLALRP